MHMSFGLYRVVISSDGDRLPDGTAVYRFHCYCLLPGSSFARARLPGASFATLIPTLDWLLYTGENQLTTITKHRRLLAAAADRIIEVLEAHTYKGRPYNYSDQLALLGHMSPDTFVGELPVYRYTAVEQGLMDEQIKASKGSLPEVPEVVCVGGCPAKPALSTLH
jgi:hypothetical protein